MWIYLLHLSAFVSNVSPSKPRLVFLLLLFFLPLFCRIVDAFLPSRTSVVLSRPLRVHSSAHGAQPVLFSLLLRHPRVYDTRLRVRHDEEDEEDAFSELYDRSDFVDKYEKKVKAKLFDFKLNNKYYIINITVDSEGERIKAVSNLQGRVVSRTPINYVAPDITPIKKSMKNLPRGTVAI